jgi:hypothetical protein
METIDIGLLIVLILLMAWYCRRPLEQFVSTSSVAETVDAIKACNKNGKLYHEYIATSKYPITPWQFARLINLAKRNDLTTETAGIILAL